MSKSTMVLNNKWYSTDDMNGDIVGFTREHEDLTSMGSKHKCISSADLVLKFRERAKNMGLVLSNEKAGLEKKYEVNGIVKGGKKFLYLAEIADDSHPDYSLTLGMRNNSDKTLSYSTIAGSNVFLCCNGVCNSICQDGKMRHTIGNIANNVIEHKIDIAFRQFNNDREKIHRQISMMKSTKLTDEIVGKFVKKMVHNPFVGATNLIRMIEMILEDVENPALNSHSDDSVFRLMNSASYVTTHKIKNPNQQIMASRECNNIIMSLIDEAFVPLGDVIDVEGEVETDAA